MIKKLIAVISAFMVITGMTAAARAESDFKSRVGDLVKIESIRMYSDGDRRVRIVVDATKPVEYRTFILSNPTRVAIDIKKAWLSPLIPKETVVDGNLVGKLRVSQNDPATVRVVVEANVSKDRYRIFSLKANPEMNKLPRIVMDFGDLAQDADLSAVVTDDALPPVESPQFPKPEEIKLFDKPGLKDKIIAIDPGHGGSDSGAVGVSGSHEKDITLKIALELKKLLEQAGAKPVLTRTGDKDVAKPNASAVEELQARVDVGKKAKAHIFVSIHMDAFVNRAAGGTSAYIYPKTNGDVRLGRLVKDELVKALGTSDRNVRNCNFYVVKHSPMPATLVEVAFISNPKEEKLLLSSAGAKKAAGGIFAGLNKYFAAD